MITLITPTGDRPEAFALCERWMRRQTYEGPLQWIVVDDGKTSTETTLNQDYVRREPVRGEEQPTLHQNILHAIPHVKGRRVFMIEDDDWYAENYLDFTLKRLNEFGLVGEGEARYYHLPSGRYQQLANMNHASLCETAFNVDLLPMLRRACLDRSPWGGIDINFWRFCQPQTASRVFRGCGLSVGMKGLPGRTGCGSGHRLAEKGIGAIDEDRSILRSWVGKNDAADYLALIEEPALE